MVCFCGCPPNPQDIFAITFTQSEFSLISSILEYCSLWSLPCTSPNASLPTLGINDSDTHQALGTEFVFQQLDLSCNSLLKVCLSLAVNIACELKQRVRYIDSTGGLCASRLLRLIQEQVNSLEGQSEALQRIEVARVFEVYHLLDVLQDLRTSFTSQVTTARSSVKAVVIDSVSAVLSSVLGGHQLEGMSLMMQLARELKTMARELNVAVIVTNSVVQDPGGRGVKPALGRTWRYVPNVRVLLQRGTEGDDLQPVKRTATILKSSRQPTRRSTEFDITSCGTLTNRTTSSQHSAGDLDNTD
ncbi:DNA repair protein RAD51 homolog 4 [Rhincodon typus]|uniref:DNA repair protein RAD51 homolog 4 n=1 Tax=Rhincodon typus TaxID=259920 RepID=UPI00202FB27A|nr:DNA repair protein RAD51 homolog 4 [Rhincodon typus]